MNEQDFYRLVKETVADYANAHLDKADGKQITPDEFTLSGCARPSRTAKHSQVQPCLTGCIMK